MPPRFPMGMPPRDAADRAALGVTSGSCSAKPPETSNPVAPCSGDRLNLPDASWKPQKQVDAYGSGASFPPAELLVGAIELSKDGVSPALKALKMRPLPLSRTSGCSGWITAPSRSGRSRRDIAGTSMA